MKPSPGYAFIIEDEKPTETETGIALRHTNKSAGSMGIIYAINGKVICPHCQEACNRDDLKKGDHVVYSRFTAEHIEFSEEGMPKGRLFAVPVESILAQI